MVAEFDADQVIFEVTDVLARKFPDKDRAEVASAVRQQVEELKDRPVHEYVSVLAQRAAKKQLNAS